MTRARTAWMPRILPTTRRGRVACWILVAFVAWVVLNIFDAGIKGHGLVAFAAGLATGVVALVSIVRDKERSVLAFVCVLVTLGVVALSVWGE